MFEIDIWRAANLTQAVRRSTNFPVYSAHSDDLHEILDTVVA
jgi:hypothetical protein